MCLRFVRYYEYVYTAYTQLALVLPQSVLYIIQDTDQHSNHSAIYKMKFHPQYSHLDYSKSMFVSILMHIYHGQVIPFVHCHVVYHICLLRELWFDYKVLFEANHVVCLDIVVYFWRMQ